MNNALKTRKLYVDGLRIEKAFGLSMNTMLRMQAWFDAQSMRRRAGEIDVKRYREKAVSQKRSDALKK